MNWADETYTNAEATEEYDILDVLKAAGARIGRSRGRGWWDDEVPVFCPFCSDSSSRKPAGRANTTKQVYHCWACGFGGNALTIATKVMDGDRAAAQRWLEEEVAKVAR